MKHFYILLYVTTLIAGNCNAQSACYSFDNFTVPLDSQASAFNSYGNGNPGFLQDWWVTCGTPSIETSGELNNINAYDGTQYAFMGVCNIDQPWSEGLSLTYNFQKGQSYSISFAAQTTPITGDTSSPLDIDFILLKDTIYYVYLSVDAGCSPTPDIPQGALLVDSLRDYTKNSWTIKTITIPNVPDNFTQFWIRARFAPNAPIQSTGFIFDSLCVQNITPPTGTCYSFDNFTVPLDSQGSAFNSYGNGNSGFLQDWWVTCGTPSIETSGELNNINAYDGTQYAFMGVCNIDQPWSEGLSLTYDFQKGQSYNISFAAQTTPITGDTSSPLDIDFILLKDTIYYVYLSVDAGCSPTPDIPQGALLVDSLRNYTKNSWTIKTITIPNVPDNFTQFWIRAQFSPNAPIQSTGFIFDSLCINSGAAAGIMPIDKPLADIPILYQNKQNPFSGQTTINYYLPDGYFKKYAIKIFDVTGKLIRYYPLKADGYGSINFDGSDMSAGIFVYSLFENERWVDSKKMIIAK